MGFDSVPIPETLGGRSAADGVVAPLRLRKAPRLQGLHLGGTHRRRLARVPRLAVQRIQPPLVDPRRLPFGARSRFTPSSSACPQSRKLAVGALWGSTTRAASGSSRSPSSRSCPPGSRAASVLTALDYLPVFESRAREIRRKYDAGGSLAAVYQELRGARIEIPVRKDGADPRPARGGARTLARRSSRDGPLRRRRRGAVGRAPLRPRRGGPKPRRRERRRSASRSPTRRPRSISSSSGPSGSRRPRRGSGSDGVLYRTGGEVAARRDLLPRRESGGHPPLSPGGDSDRFRRGDSETRPPRTAAAAASKEVPARTPPATETAEARRLPCPRRATDAVPTPPAPAPARRRPRRRPIPTPAAEPPATPAPSRLRNLPRLATGDDPHSEPPRPPEPPRRSASPRRSGAQPAAPEPPGRSRSPGRDRFRNRRPLPNCRPSPIPPLPSAEPPPCRRRPPPNHRRCAVPRPCARGLGSPARLAPRERLNPSFAAAGEVFHATSALLTHGI